MSREKSICCAIRIFDLYNIMSQKIVSIHTSDRLEETQLRRENMALINTNVRTGNTRNKATKNR